VLVTAGPTAEDIDDVRFLTNRSTGRMGFAVAAEALRRGWQAVLVAGPTPGEPPEDAACLRVRSAREMLDAVLAAFPETDALVMAAAVADYTPAEPVRGKLKKTPGELHLRLIRTTDILAAVRDHPARAGRVVIGFALEAEPDPEEARRKLREKRLDGIVLNTPAAFGTESTAARLLLPGSEDPAGPFGRKTDLARAICDRIAAGSSSGSG
jgi:phosphopantothenoylcysteine decarboxylase/phosphopantothenate--cysteine ligase